ncbi:MAG: protein jag [Lachnospiraceae bacterium]|nr:protein jag [Lachnospiraceae bacterium]
MEYQNFKGKTVEDALTNASVALGLTSDHISYEVIEKGSSGFLGFASKEAVIRVVVGEEKTAGEDKAEAASASVENEKLTGNQDVTEKSSDSSDQKTIDNETADDSNADSKEAAGKKSSDSRSSHERSDARRKELSEEDLSEIKTIAENFLKDVFDKMGLTVEIHEEYDSENRSLNLDLIGPDMGVIIGKRGQTLDSLQYLTNLVVNRKTSSYVRIKIDTENYRERRKETLENLAHNVAYKVKKTRRPVALESMNPYERRIIHAALSDDEYVTTHSEGEEPYRHVVVTLK